MKKAMSKTLCMLMGIIIMWFLFSYIEIITSNTTTAPEYNEYNIFIMITNLKEMF